MHQIALLGFFLSQAGAQQLPALMIEAPTEFASVRARLESFDQQRLSDIRRLLGITDLGPPVQVVLALESSGWAHQVWPWVAGFALDAPEMVVIFSSRSLSYPHDTLDDVLR